MNFLQQVKDKAKKAGKTIVLPESLDARTLKATAIILAEGLAKVILVGSEEKIRAAAKDEGQNIDGAKIIDPASYEGFDSLVTTLHELRKAKGMTLDEAKKSLT